MASKLLFLNACLPILSNFSGNTKEVILLSENAETPIFCRLSGNLTVLNFKSSS